MFIQSRITLGSGSLIAPSRREEVIEENENDWDAQKNTARGRKLKDVVLRCGMQEVVD